MYSISTFTYFNQDSESYTVHYVPQTGFPLVHKHQIEGLSRAFKLIELIYFKTVYNVH